MLGEFWLGASLTGSRSAGCVVRTILGTQWWRKLQSPRSRNAQASVQCYGVADSIAFLPTVGAACKLLPANEPPPRDESEPAGPRPQERLP
jgi:hypothetical protein